MKTNLHHSFRSLGLLSAIASVGALQAFADPTPPNQPIPRPLPRPIVRPSPLPPVRIPGKLQPIQLDPKLIEGIRKGQAVAHKPYTLRDPSSGNGAENQAKQISPNAQLPAFPNGKSVQAGKYFEELNRFESHVNEFGYTLREKGPSNINFGRIRLNLAEFTEKQKEAVRLHNPKLIMPKLPIAEHEKAYRDRLAKSPALLDSIAKHLRGMPIHLKPKTYSASKSWSGSWGWSNKFATFVSTQLSMSGTSDVTKAHGTGDAGGFIFGQQLKLVHGDASYDTPKAGAMKGDVSLYVLGYKVFNQNYNSSSGYFYNHEWSKGIDEGTEIYFALGPIPMSARLGAKGSVGMSYRMAILPLRANVDVVPGVHTSVYIQVGVDLIVGGAGAGSSLVLLNDELTLAARLHVLMDSKGPYFAASFLADNEMVTLLGKVYAYVFLYVPRWGLPPWEKKQWNWTLFELGGVSVHGSILNQSDKLYLF